MFGVKLGGGEIGGSAGVSLPSLPKRNETVTLNSKDGAGFGFELGSDGHGGLVVASVSDGGPAKASGQIQPGDRVDGISLDLGNTGVAAAQRAMDALAEANCPLLFNVSRQSKPDDVHLTTKVKAPKIGLTGDAQKPDITGPQLELPDASLSGNVQGPDINNSKVGISGSTDIPDVNVPSGGSSASFDAPSISIPNIGGTATVNMAHADLPKDGFDAGLQSPDWKISGGMKPPKVNLPDAKISGNNEDMSATGQANIGLNPHEIDISLPTIDIDAPRVAVGGNIDVDDREVDNKIPGIDIHARGPSFGDKVKGFFRGDSKRKKKKVPTATLR